MIRFAWLQFRLQAAATAADLLWERRQVICYGPPGTGKTCLATRLARQLTADGAVKLVQFHPPAPARTSPRGSGRNPARAAG